MPGLKALLLLPLFFISPPAVGAIDFEDAVFPEIIVSSRALAMGNAYVAKADDSASPFYNPAGLGTVRKWRFSFSNFYAEINKDLSDATKGGASDSISNYSKGLSLDGTRELLLENRGSSTHSRFHLAPHFIFRYFSAGVFYSTRQIATIGTQSDAEFEYAKRTDYGPFGSMNLSLGGGVLKLGGTVMYLARREATGEEDRDTTIDLEDNDYQKGSMLYIVGGAKLTLPIAFLPTFAATLHNATNQAFASAGGKGLPEKIEQTIDVGFSLTPQIGKRVRLHIEANYKDIGNAHSGVSSTRKLTFGMELDVARRLFFRVGYGDGFGSAGIGMRTRPIELDISTYAVDTTSTEFRGKEDRRFAFTLSTGF